MYHVSAQGIDERMINVHYYYYYYYYYLLLIELFCYAMQIKILHLIFDHWTIVM